MITIALHADNEKKALLDNFCIAYKHVLSKYHLIATESTANHVKLATGLQITALLAGGLGGDKQLEAALLNNEVDLLISFERVSFETFHQPSDHNALVRLCDLQNIPVATNITTAECLILSAQRGDLEWREMLKQ